MRMKRIFILLPVIMLAGCDDDGSTGRDTEPCSSTQCDADCQDDGYRGGLCKNGECICAPDQDASTNGGTDSDSDSDADTDSDSDTDSDGDGFEPTQGTSAEVDRTEPCGQDDIVRYAPQDQIVIQVCVQNLWIWAPVECGYQGQDKCQGCSASVCSTKGEVAQQIDTACVCYNPCSDQKDGARCGKNNERSCLPIDAAGGQQVFVCAGEM